jgi:hypothetical protein
MVLLLGKAVIIRNHGILQVAISLFKVFSELE